MKKIFVTLMVISLCSVLRGQGNNYVQEYKKFYGLALTLPMGWNSWNKFACNVDENMIKQIADAIVAKDMKDAGYAYINKMGQYVINAMSADQQLMVYRIIQEQTSL